MLWVAMGYFAFTYLYALWSQAAARTAVSLGNAGYVIGPNVYAVALALFAVSPVYVPLVATFTFFARRPAAAARWGTRIGVLVQQPMEEESK